MFPPSVRFHTVASPVVQLVTLFRSQLAIRIGYFILGIVSRVVKFADKGTSASASPQQSANNLFFHATMVLQFGAPAGLNIKKVPSATGSAFHRYPYSSFQYKVASPLEASVYIACDILAGLAFKLPSVSNLAYPSHV